ncbi:MAG: histidine phosphotransferase, partial [Sphingomonas sp.]|nr:histidine phosphotransferase [Sphingomonas sp.]
LSKGGTKLLLNLALIGGDALLRGGRLDVGAESGAEGLEIVIRAEGPRVVVHQGVREILVSGREDAVEPHSAGAWLAYSLAAQAGGSILLSQPSDTVLMIGATLPT